MSDDRIVTRCVRCNRGLDSGFDTWSDTVNLCSDVLFVGETTVLLEDTPDERDIAFDWCSPDCFAESLFEAAEKCEWRARP